MLPSRYFSLFGFLDTTLESGHRKCFLVCAGAVGIWMSLTEISVLFPRVDTSWSFVFWLSQCRYSSTDQTGVSALVMSCKCHSSRFLARSKLNVANFLLFLFLFFKFPWGVSHSWSGSQGCRSPSHQPLHGRQECTLSLSLWEEICYLMIRFCNQSNFLEWTGNKVISQSRRNTTLLNLTDIFPPERWCKISGQTGKTTEYTQTNILQMLKADHRSSLDIRSKFYSHRQESPRWETKLDGSKRWHCQCKKHLDWGSDSQRWRNEVPEDTEERKKMKNKYWDQNQLEHRRR